MRQRQRSNITGPNGALLEYPLSTARFIAPLRNTLAPSAGYGPATFTRTTTATYFDNEGMLKEVRAGAARFTGARRVSNLIPESEGDSTWQALGTTPPTVQTSVTYDGKTCISVTFPAGVGSFGISRGARSVDIPVVAGRDYTLSYLIAFSRPLVGGEVINVISGGASTLCLTAYNTSNNLTTTLTRQSATTTNCPTSGNNGFIVYPNATLSAPITVYVSERQLEDVTGQTDQTYSEYVHSGKDQPNRLNYTEYFTASGWSNTNLTVTQNSIANPIDSRVNATKATATATAVTSLFQNSTATGTDMTFSVYVKIGNVATSMNRFLFRNSTTATNLVGATIDYTTGVLTYTVGSTGASSTNAGNGWWRLTFQASSGINIGDTIALYMINHGLSETSGNYVYIYGPQFSKTSVAGNYTPVGAAYDPHGSGADGVKYFNTNKDGTPITSSYNKGYLNEGARTNNLLYCRNLTNAAWVKTTMTTALTSTGLDGNTNSATRLTATGANSKCLQTITLAAATRTFSAYVKRITGTGTIEITRDNGTSWTDITSLITTGTYSRVYIAATSVTNPTCGFRIVTSGDAIDVDYCQDEAGSFPSNPIYTTTVASTRNTDLLYYIASGNYSNSSGTILGAFGYSEVSSTLSIQMNAITSDGAGRFAYGNSTTTGNKISAWDGSFAPNSTGDSRVLGAIKKFSTAWGSNLRIITQGALSGGSSSFDGTMGDGIYLIVGAVSTGASTPLYGNINGIYIWSTELTDTQMRQIVA